MGGLLDVESLGATLCALILFALVQVYTVGSQTNLHAHYVNGAHVFANSYSFWMYPLAYLYVCQHKYMAYSIVKECASVTPSNACTHVFGFQVYHCA